MSKKVCIKTENYNTLYNTVKQRLRFVSSEPDHSNKLKEDLEELLDEISRGDKNV